MLHVVILEAVYKLQAESIFLYKLILSEHGLAPTMEVLRIWDE